jgi:hypothetical protein
MPAPEQQSPQFVLTADLLVVDQLPNYDLAR